MNEKVQQRFCIKLCYKNGISFSETLAMLKKAFGENAMSRANLFDWYKLFKEDREHVGDDEHSDHFSPSNFENHVKEVNRSKEGKEHLEEEDDSSNHFPIEATHENHVKKIELFEEGTSHERLGHLSTYFDQHQISEVKNLVLKNHRLTIRDLVDITQISAESIKSILKDHLFLKHVSCRLVPQKLKFFEKEHRLNVCETMISDYQNLIKRIITGDQIWIYAYDSKINNQSNECDTKGDHKPKKLRQNELKLKVMLTVFFDYLGLVHYEFLPSGQTASKEYYLNVLRRLREAIRQKRPELWTDNSWLLHYDNAISQTAMVFRSFFTRNSIHIIPQPPYSPDLAPSDFWLTSKLKKVLRGHYFDSVEELQATLKKILETIPEIEFDNCFTDWKTRWRKCILSEGDYLDEEDEINF